MVTPETNHSPYLSFSFSPVPTLVQLLKDIDSAEEIVEYVQPYIGSVIKAREFAADFISKRKQLSHAEVDPSFSHRSLTIFSLFSHSSRHWITIV